MGKLAVVGSRDFPDLDLVEKILQSRVGPMITGDASGVDRKVANFADEYNIELEVFEANWDKYGKQAGPIRNQEIVDEADYVLAFWDGESRGTKDTIDKAVKAGIPVDVFIRAEEVK